jgi:hypothetical protein
MSAVNLGHLHLWWSWRLYFEPRDCWIGLYWKRYPQAIDLYICGLPMLPLNLYIQWERRA